MRGKTCIDDGDCSSSSFLYPPAYAGERKEELLVQSDFSLLEKGGRRGIFLIEINADTIPQALFFGKGEEEWEGSFLDHFSCHGTLPKIREDLFWRVFCLFGSAV